MAVKWDEVRHKSTLSRQQHSSPPLAGAYGGDRDLCAASGLLEKSQREGRPRAATGAEEEGEAEASRGHPCRVRLGGCTRNLFNGALITEDRAFRRLPEAALVRLVFITPRISWQEGLLL